VTGLTVIGAGDVLRRYVLGAAAATGSGYPLTICDVVDVRPIAVTRRACARAGCDDHVCIHRLAPDDPRGFARLASGLRRRQPVVVATPTPSHVSYAVDALSAGLTVAVEKPYAATAADAMSLDPWLAPSDGQRRLFLLGYYVLEKALPLLLLARRGAVPAAYASCVTVTHGTGSWGEWRAALGPLRQLSACILEGVGGKRSLSARSWVLDPASGGITLEQLYHLACIVALFADGEDVLVETVRLFTDRSVATRRSNEGSGGTAETLSGAVLLTSGGAVARIVAGKYVRAAAHQRWVNAEFEHGSVFMDLETMAMAGQAGGCSWAAHTTDPTPYATQFKIFGAKLAGADIAPELPLSKAGLALTSNIRATGLAAGIDTTDTPVLSRGLFDRVLRGDLELGALAT
jgi:hypothetical protein